MSQRKKDLDEIKRKNLQMVNSLILVKPNVPLARDLKKWSHRHESLISQLHQVRYGTPKPIKGITVRMSL